MRIAEVAPLAESVPPKLYGGTERVVSWLTEELVGLGCEVTLFASGDSCTSAALVPACQRALRLSRPIPDPWSAYAALLDAIAEKATTFDMIHCHTDWIHMPLLRRGDVPFVTTMHGRLDLPSLPMVTGGFKHAPLISISDAQRTPLQDFNWIGTVYHGLPPDLLSPQTRPTSSYLAFLGRISPEKGPDVAIRIARTVGLPLRIAAKIPRSETRYFKEHIRPLLDGSCVEFVGEVDDAAKADSQQSGKSAVSPSIDLVKFALLFLALYAAFGVASPFLPEFLLLHGVGPERLGLALSLATTIRLISAPLAGRVADRLHALRIVPAICAAMGGTAALVFLPAFGFPVLLFVALLHAAMLAPTSVLADALALGAAATSSDTRFRFEYGWVRGLALQL